MEFSDITKPFDKNYLWFMGMAMFFHLVAAFCTINIVGSGLGYGANLVPRLLFDTIGIIPTTVFGIITMIYFMIYVPYYLKENENVGLYSFIFFTVIIVAMFIDASNDVFQLITLNPHFFTTTLGLFI